MTTFRRVAVCCDDAGLSADVRRLCAAAGLDTEVTGTADAARWWSVAAGVLVDTAAAADLTGRSLPRRDGVAIVTRTSDAEAWRLAVQIGAEQVAVLPGDEQALHGGILAAGGTGARPTVVACLPATGGAGASTVAVGVAHAASRGGVATLLVDGDPKGGGLDLLLGAELVDGLRWPDLLPLGPEPVPPATLDALVRPSSSLRLLSWDRRGGRAELAAALPMLLRGAAATAQLVVVDLPRQATAGEPLPGDVTLLVVRADVRSAAAAVGLADDARARGDDVRLVVRTGQGSLTADQIATATRLPVALQIPHDRKLPAAADEGQLVRALARHGFASLVAALCPAAGAPHAA